MAILIAEPGAVESDVIASTLVDDLSDDIYVLARPTVYGRELSWLVIASSGLYHLEFSDWQGPAWASDSDGWAVQGPGGETELQPNPALAFRDHQQAIGSFLADEFPDFAPPVFGRLVYLDRLPEIYGSTGDLKTGLLSDIVLEIENAVPARASGLESAEQRAELATAFDERRLARRQRASRPFVLATGGALKANLSAWTIDALLPLLDRHPESAGRHMMDGSLEEWLDTEGAFRLADLVRTALERHSSDPRAALESFMVSTGYVEPPQLWVRPNHLTMGYALVDEVIRQELMIGKQRGRGYIHGSLVPEQPWVRVEPNQFSGRTRVMVSVDTSSLPVGIESRSALIVRTEASGSQLSLPVAIRVRAIPPKTTRWLVRPLLGLVAGVGAGVALGLVLAPLLAGLPGAPVDGSLTILLAAVLFGVCGGLRGLYQAPAWPNPHAVGRWLLRILAWAVGAIVIGGGLLGLAARLFPSAGWASTGIANATGLIALALLLAVVPATLVENASARASQQEPRYTEHKRLQRRVRRGAVVLALVVAGMIGFRIAQPSLQVAAASERASAVKDRAEALVVSLQARLDAFADGLYVQYLEEQKPGNTQGPRKILEWFGGGGQ